MNNTLESAAPQSAPTTPAGEVEIIDTDPAVKAVTVELQKYASQTGLEAPAQQTLAEAFRPVFLRAHAAITSATGVAESVKDATCVREIRKSRECRLKIREVRLDGEKVHKEQKQSALRFVRAVDGFRNILLAEIEPVEKALALAETTAERTEAARLFNLKAQREMELLPLLDGSPILADLSLLSLDAWTKLLGDHMLLKQAKLDAAAKLEADRLAKEAADRADRERIAAENARLKAEAQATKKRLEEERQAREAQAAKERAEREEEQRRIEAERKAEREKAERDAEALRCKIATERKAADDLAKAVAAKADAETAKLKADLEALARVQAQAVADEQARVELDRIAKDSAARRAAAAPDRAKLESYLVALNALPLPKLTDEGYYQILKDDRNRFADAIEQLIIAL